MLENLRNWFSFRAVDHEPWELYLFRLGFAAVVWVSVPELITYTSQPDPVGFGRFIDFSFFGNPEILKWSRIALIPALIAYVFGVGMPLATTVMAFVGIGTGVLGNSQGSDHHHLQAAHMCLLVVWLWHLGAGVWNLLRKPSSLPRADRLNREAHYLKQAFAAGYVVSAISKLVNSRGQWISQSKNFSLQIHKTERMHYHNDHAADASQAASFVDRIPEILEQLFIKSPHLAPWFMGPALFVELLAFLGLIGRKMAFCIGLLVIGLHYSIGKVMNLHFNLNLAITVIFFLNFPWWIFQFGKWLKAKRRSIPQEG